METLGHYGHMIESNEWLEESKSDIRELVSQLRKDGAAEPTLIELEQQIDYVLSQWRGAFIDLFKVQCANDELNEKLDQLKTLVNGEL